MMRKILLILSVTFCFGGLTQNVFSADRDLSGIDLVTRTDRGAEESARTVEHPRYTWRKENNAAYEARITSGGPTGDAAFLERKKRREAYDVSNTWLKNNYPEDIDVQEFALPKRGYSLDYVVHAEDGKELRRPLMYEDNKSKIVIHHTAGAQAFDLAQGKKRMEELAQQHTFSNGRGDVGYHFLIDTAGNIYEGRAGGPGVIGAHMTWNNTTSIGIALMGDFEEVQPSDEMIASLVRLTTSLSREFDIDPFAKTTLYTATDQVPFLYATAHDSIVGHKDGSATACPGKHIHSLIPSIKSQTAALLNYFRSQGNLDFDKVQVHPTEYVEYTDSSSISLTTIPLQGGSEVSCAIFDETIDIQDCAASDDGLILTLTANSYHGSGRVPLVITQDDTIHLIHLVLLWQQDLDQLLVHRKAIYTQVYGTQGTNLLTNKITAPVDASTIQEHTEQDVKVLLYELSTAFSEWNMLCEQGCTVKTDNETFLNASQIDVISYPDRMELIVDGTPATTTYLILKNSGIVSFTNYGRASYAGIAWNRFRGDIIIQKERMRHLQEGWIDGRTVVNRLPFYDYLKGIVETNDQDDLEKIKAIFLAVKNYTAHYLDGENLHPFIPTDGSFTMVDDPRVMQKYAGYGVEQTITKRYEAMRQLQDTRVTYNNEVIILPYYHCGPGFTRSGHEYFGRKDTPRLRGVLDVASCPESSKFKGHGVGMSGVGAQRMAEYGVKFDEILRWYYRGVSIE